MPTMRVIDPATRDYVLENGRYRQTATASTAIYMAVATAQGTHALDPDLGTLLRELNLDTATAPELAEQTVSLALDRLVTAGQLLSYEVSATRPAPGRLLIEVLARDRIGRDEEVSIVI